MKRLALLLAATAIATPSMAADILVPEPPAPAPMAIEPIAQTTTWSGLNLGVQAGVAFGNSDNGANFNTDDGVFGDGIFDDDDNAGFIGGAHVGYDYQFQNNVVLGAVADFNYIDAETNRSYTTPGGAEFSSNSEINYLGTVRARLGYAMDNVLVYGSGGLAYAGVDNNISSPNIDGYEFDSSGDDADIGYSVGAGVDVMATQNLSFGVEYLYTNLGSNEQSVTGTNDVTGDTIRYTTDSNDEDLDFHTVWAKASYHFN